MQKIIVKDFSCIKSAALEVAPLTLVIGPQASGKSVLSKLIYFCTNIISGYDRFAIEDRLSFDALERRIAALFIEWFPISAWGSKRFSIQFELGTFKVEIARIGKSDRARIKFCEQFVAFYENAHEKFSIALRKAEMRAEAHAEFYDYELMYRLRHSASLSLRKWLGRDFVENQLFVPAGRSFFTSVGKALVAFEHSGILDPVTLEFGRKFSAIRERFTRRVPTIGVTQSPLADILFSEILGGHLKVRGGKEYIQAADGRLIPFSALSSGQQELLPLAVAIRAMLPSGVLRHGVPTGGALSIRRAIYIEEPEAHLFPYAQNKLVEILAALVARRRFTNLLLTTHSPYVLAKFNNLIKAGSLVRTGKGKSNADLAKVIPETSWLTPNSVNAYAIIDGQLNGIMDETGLIAADYLDDVSGDIAREFSKLLAIEVGR